MRSYRRRNTVRADILKEFGSANVQPVRFWILSFIAFAAFSDAAPAGLMLAAAALTG
jgi:hypothetical protein